MRPILRKNWKGLSSLMALLLALGITSQLGACSGDEDPPSTAQPPPTGTSDAGDAGDAGEPILTYRTSWLGEWLLPDDAKARDPSKPLDLATRESDGMEKQKRRWIQPRLDAIWVNPSGRIYANTLHPVESSRTLGVYDYSDTPIGTDKGSIRPVASALEAYAQGGDGRAITGDEKYLYADAMFKDGDWPDGGPKLRRVLVRFNPTDLEPLYDWIRMSPFPGGDSVRSSLTAGRNLGATPAGLAVGYPAGANPPHFVFVSLPDKKEIRVYEREGMTQVASNAVTNPGALAFRASTNSLFAIEDGGGKRVVQEWKIGTSGTLSPGDTITDLVDPVAIAVSQDKIYIADNAAAIQQIRIYQRNGQNKYAEAGRLGQPGGVAAAKGQYADDRFDNLTGVGADDEGNVYVASNGYTRSVGGTTDLRRFSPQKQLQAKAVKYNYQDIVVADPLDATKVYSATRKYTLDYSQQGPGTEWSPNRTSVTVDRKGCPHDARNPHPTTGNFHQSQAVALRHLKDDRGVAQGKYLYVQNWGSAANALGIYRFDDDDAIARPSVVFSEGATELPNEPQASGKRRQWVDQNANCTIDPGELEDVMTPYIALAHDIDEAGGIWSANTTHVLHYPIKRFEGYNPIYLESCAGDAGSTACATVPEQFPLNSNLRMKTIARIKYIAATDTLYVLGGNPIDGSVSSTWSLARYDSFTHTPGGIKKWNKEIRPLYVPCLSNDRKIDFCTPEAMAVVGHRVYVADQGNDLFQPGRVRTFDTESGDPAGSLYAGPEVAQVAGYVDGFAGMTALQLPTGEHVIFREEMFLGRILMYRYTPSN
ncbi:hypothetical protein LZC95_22135 [Pendulispora brunnea]|uniref:NHL repeat-containing protein n=1 Tax=Pendulispora brunnea TaxID=2905690 RepID=A0ABZ2KPK6_9BACT